MATKGGRKLTTRVQMEFDLKRMKVGLLRTNRVQL